MEKMKIIRSAVLLLVLFAVNVLGLEEVRYIRYIRTVDGDTIKVE